MAKVLMIVAHRDFRGEEYAYPKEVFEGAGFEVIAASSKKGVAKSAPVGVTANVTVSLSEVDVKCYEAVVFVGGSGAEEYFENDAAFGIARDAASLGKVLGAICIAPVILARAGVLSGKNATVFPGSEGELKKAGAYCTGEDVAVDGHIVTANGPKAAKKFAEAVVGLIKAPSREFEWQKKGSARNPKA